MKHIKIPHILQQFNTIFEDNNYEAFLVGGAVRDIIRGKNPSDYDITTNAEPEKVAEIFRQNKCLVIPTGIEHGTVTVHFNNEEIEVTTYRLEKEYSDGRHPDKIEYASNIEEDLSRRDFTMNAIAASLKNGEIVDPFNGQNDIKHKIIRTVGIAEDRFNEDGLRPIRAIRFASQTGFSIEEKTLEAIPKAIEKTKGISIERFRDEFTKLISSTNPEKGLRLLEKTGILSFFIPELIGCRDVIQADFRGFHKYDVLDHMYFAAEGAAWIEKQRGTEVNLPVRLTALFHDIGKPTCKKTEYKDCGNIVYSATTENSKYSAKNDYNKLTTKSQTSNENQIPIYTFFNHDIVGGKITNAVLERLRYPKALCRYVSHLVSQHMFHYEPNWTDAAIRRFLVRITPPDAKDKTANSCEVQKAIKDIFDVRIADVCGMTGTPAIIDKGPWSQNLLEFKNRIEKITMENTAISLKDLAVSGQDLIASGIPAGKNLGNILNQLLDIVLDNPNQNNKETLLFIAKNIFQQQKRVEDQG